MGVIADKKEERKIREVKKRLKGHAGKMQCTSFKWWGGVFEVLDEDDFRDACQDAGIIDELRITGKYNTANELHLKKQRQEKWSWCKLTKERCRFKLPCESVDSRGMFLCPTRQGIVQQAWKKIQMQQKLQGVQT